MRSLPLLLLTCVLISESISVNGFLFQRSGRSQYNRPSVGIITPYGTANSRLFNDYHVNDDELDNDGNNNEMEGMELEFDKEIQKRSQQRQSPSTKDDASSDPRPFLILMPDTMTKIGTLEEELEFRLKERELLSELLDGGEAVAKLRQLWFAEYGPESEAQLYLADACIGKGQEDDNWTKAEDILLELIQQHPTFLEPFVRLSKLYTLQGRFADSQQICLAIHAVRPWHYVVLETMVVNTMVLEHNEDLKGWASKRLPTPSLSQERLAWVQQAIANSIRLEEESILQRKRQEMPESKDEYGSALGAGETIVGKDEEEEGLEWQ